MVMVLNPALHTLRKGMKDAGLTVQGLFSEYEDRGGKAKQPGTLGAWLRGERDAPATQLALLFTIVNEHLERKGLPQMDVPFPFGLVQTDSRPEGNDGLSDLTVSLVPFSDPGVQATQREIAA